ncbi:DUF1682-domain-containing protein [Chiua virens]|nr:DUF1682-domain-containing protein [Chiua virens]
MIMSLLAFFTPPPPLIPDDYDGINSAGVFSYSDPLACLLLGVFIYFALALYGKYRNKRTADALYNALSPLLDRNFSAPASSSGLISDGPTDFFVFSTGRRALASLHTVLTLVPRQDPLQLLSQLLWKFYDLRYQPRDRLTLDFLLDANAAAALPDFAWAVVHKSELTTIKENRWDLTFTRTTEHPSLPPALSVMSEFADVSEALFKLNVSPSVTLSALLATPSFTSYLRSLSRVLLEINLPDSKHAQDILPLVDAIFALVDLFAAGKVVLRPETKAKIRKVRDDVEKEIKEDETREKREEAAEDKKAAKRKAEQDKIAKLSPAEQKKVAFLCSWVYYAISHFNLQLLERNHKRAVKKSQGKVVRKA